jgi:hypothetical protein
MFITYYIDLRILHQILRMVFVLAFPRGFKPHIVPKQIKVFNILEQSTFCKHK